MVEKRMIEPFDSRRGHPQTFKKSQGKMISTGVFLQQELVRFNELIQVMRMTLRDLQRAIKGFIVMSGPLEAMYNDFIFQRVPAQWENAGYPCLKPLPSWTEDHFARLTFMGSWLKDGPPNAYWLSCFFFPQGFMTAVKQTYSRDYKIAIDTLMVSVICENFEKEDNKTPPKDGVYIYGLYCEAARFDRGSMVLEESHPADLFSEMPVMHLLPCMVDEYDNKDTYSCPCYKTSLRFGVLSTTGHSTNQVCNFDIPTGVEAAHWTRRGTALLCMLDY
jgi:dynein heavy chain